MKLIESHNCCRKNTITAIFSATYADRKFNGEEYDKCFLDANDRRILKTVQESNVVTLTSEQLNEIREKSEKIYAFIYLINDNVEKIQKCAELDTEAKTFFKKVGLSKNLTYK